MARAAKSIEQLELQLEKERTYRHEIEMAQRLIAIALQALSIRLLTSIALVVNCAMFAWALANGAWQALATAVLCAVASWALIYLRPPDRKESERSET